MEPLERRPPDRRLRGRCARRAVSGLLYLAAASAQAQIKAVVIPVSFADAPLQISTAQVTSTTEWAVKFWEEIGYGRLGISYVVSTPVTISKPRPTVCDWSSWPPEAINKAAALGFTGARKIFFSPSLPCPGTNNGNLGFPFYLFMHNTDSRSMAHELGHTFGLRHAARLTGCPATGFDPARCKQAEYGNHYSPMGVGSSYLSIAEAAQISVQPYPLVVDVGTYTLAALEFYGLGRGIIVKRGQGQFWIERRTPEGLDSWLTEEKILVNYLGPDVQMSNLVGLTLAAELRAGETFTDTLGGVSVRNNGSGSVVVTRFTPPTLPTKTPNPNLPTRTKTPTPASTGAPCGPPWFDPCVTATQTAIPSATRTETPTWAPTALPPTTTATATPLPTNTPSPTSTSSPTSAPTRTPKPPSHGCGNRGGSVGAGLAVAALVALRRARTPFPGDEDEPPGPELPGPDDDPTEDE